MPKGGAGAELDDTFETTGSGAAEVVPKQCSALRKSEVCMIKGKPCKIVDMSTSKTGKHGHAKVHLVGIDIFDGKKYEDICPSTHNMTVPIVKTLNFQLINIEEDDFLSLMEDGGGLKEDIKLNLDEQMGKEIKKNFDDGVSLNITIISACGKEKVSGFKVLSDK